MTKGSLEGKAALISGSGTGLGRATAVAFAREGAKVALIGRRAGKLEETAAVVRAAGGQALVLPADVSSEEQVKRAVAATLAMFGKIDVLINNAAVFEPNAAADTPLADWSRQLAVNLTGPLLLAQAVLPSMRAMHYGQIINITSSLASNGAGGYAAYAASKAGLESLTRTLADEEQNNGILVNAFNPGTVRSEMHATGKDPAQVAPHLVRLASLPAGSPTGDILEYE
ncbi:hypothetical protein BG53_02745 [Paenibacillus darwinianus]|uniref:Ketoreductase domain-containing protein n=1 Tax=Paenibacillus darwinianus TaxID=1380763 RepID=A0A9W5S080_9BACL|nr:SDR family oxidoreductase [Paenibacillus darwinianus]EXX87927.1 hypothetical protein BG53_02745 [Paenibacillus darwinianus]EXX88337.1 hypothetical protein CH50_03605 [Paenibacillus darwinianus]EXX88361.1 hypothetical protein BG52_02290 [Paenibacillus darwinianus]